MLRGGMRLPRSSLFEYGVAAILRFNTKNTHKFFCNKNMCVQKLIVYF